jgi:hypothetical protein
MWQSSRNDHGWLPMKRLFVLSEAMAQSEFLQ